MRIKASKVSVEFGRTEWCGIEVKITIRRDSRERVYERFNEDPSFRRLCETVNGGDWNIRTTESGWEAA